LGKGCYSIFRICFFSFLECINWRKYLDFVRGLDFKGVIKRGGIKVGVLKRLYWGFFFFFFGGGGDLSLGDPSIL
jgi:hypothetical protein